MIQGRKNFVWHYGAGMNDQTYKVLDVLATTNGDYNAQLWTYLAGQFHKYIINRVTVYVGNLNIANRYQQDMNTPYILNFSM